MSSSSSGSTLILVLVFLLGSALFFFFRWGGPEEEELKSYPMPPDTITRSDPSPSPFTDEETLLSPERNEVWKELNQEYDEEPINPARRLVYGLRLLLDTASSEKDVKKGIGILNAHDNLSYGGFAKLRKRLLDPARSPDFRRRELLRYLEITEQRVLLLKSVLKDRPRIHEFQRGAYVPLETEVWEDVVWPPDVILDEEPEDEALYHETLNDEPDLPAGLRDEDLLVPVDLLPPPTMPDLKTEAEKAAEEAARRSVYE